MSYKINTEKNIIESIKKTIPILFNVIKKQDYFSVNYDKKADVVYVALDEDKKADDTEVYSDDVLLRKRDNRLIGMTFLHVSSLLKQN